MCWMLASITKYMYMYCIGSGIETEFNVVVMTSLLCIIYCTHLLQVGILFPSLQPTSLSHWPFIQYLLLTLKWLMIG